MKIPDKTSITLRKASEISMGAKKITHGWQFGIFSDDTELPLILFKSTEPENGTEIHIPRTYKHGRIFSFVLEFTDEETAAGLDGVCYAVGEKRCADIYAKEYCYAGNGQDSDGFGRNREELYSILRCVNTDDNEAEECFVNAFDVAGILDNPLVYKLHVRGFTKLDSTIEEHERGSFAALAEKAPYIKALGMNMALIMPCYEFHETSMAQSDRNNCYGSGYAGDGSGKINYWGYTGGYYFAPKRAYCAGDNCIDEFRAMVRAFHECGVAVLTEMWFPPDMAPAMAVQILRYWHTLGVDGFRVIGSGGLLYAVRTDMCLSDCVLLGDDFGGDSFHAGGVQAVSDTGGRIIRYNDNFMEAARHFLRGDEDSIGAFLDRLKNHDAGHPVVNFMADQNCLSLMDMVSYEHRHNEYNGENNMDGRRYNISFNCGVEGKTKRESVLRERRRMIKNALAMVFLSASVPMFIAGDEFGMSHGGNNNPYCHDNEINYIDWELLEKNSELYEFTRKLIRFRNEHPCIRPKHGFSMNDHSIKGMPDLSCHSERAWFPLMAEYSHNIGLLYSGAYAGEQGNVYIIYNMHTEPHEFAVIEMAGKNWKCAASSDEAGVIYDEGRKRIRLAARTMAVFVSVESDK